MNIIKCLNYVFDSCAFSSISGKYFEIEVPVLIVFKIKKNYDKFFTKLDR